MWPERLEHLHPALQHAGPAQVSLHETKSRMCGGARLHRRDDTNQGGGHRVGQHRHRPDDQGHAARRTAWRSPRWSASTRPPTACARARRLGVADHRRRRRGAARACPSFDDDRDRLRRDVGRRRTSPTPRRCAPHGKRLVDLTPAAIGPFVVPAGEPRRSISTRRTSTWSPAAARPPSRSSRRSSRRDAGALRRDRRLDRLAVRRPRHPRQHRRVHRDHRAGDRGRSAAPRGARRSSSSTRPSRR